MFQDEYIAHNSLSSTLLYNVQFLSSCNKCNYYRKGTTQVYLNREEGQSDPVVTGIYAVAVNRLLQTSNLAIN